MTAADATLNRVIPFGKSDSEHLDYQTAIVLLSTCSCGGGLGHRFDANPRGAALIVRTTSAGAKCLTRRGLGQLTGRGPNVIQ